jgi:NADPH-dependent curcumin reductase CurA
LYVVFDDLLSAVDTARKGLLDVAKIKAGETLVVSGAAGAVGSIACQIGKLYGAKVIGIAGTEEKCRWLREELKIDATLNYKSPTFHDEFKNEVGFFDVFFDNVGGEILDFALTRLKKGSRITLCGEPENEADVTILSYQMTFARWHLRLQYFRFFWELSASSDGPRCRCS